MGPVSDDVLEGIPDVVDAHVRGQVVDFHVDAVAVEAVEQPLEAQEGDQNPVQVCVLVSVFQLFPKEQREAVDHLDPLLAGHPRVGRVRYGTSLWSEWDVRHKIIAQKHPFVNRFDRF